MLRDASRGGMGDPTRRPARACSFAAACARHDARTERRQPAAEAEADWKALQTTHNPQAAAACSASSR
jgi:hypothetical protein